MADLTTGELAAVRDATVGELPQAADIYDDFLMPGEFQGEAKHITGEQWKKYAIAAVRDQNSNGWQAANAAAQAAQQATSGASNARISANAAAQSAANASNAATAAQTERQNAEKARDAAAGYASNANDSAKKSESWAIGGTGTRTGEDTNNSKYWANRAQAEAERVTVPPVEGVYNIILADRATNDHYALLIENGRLELLGVSNALKATDLNIIDSVTGKAYKVIADDGRITIEEVA